MLGIRKGAIVKHLKKVGSYVVIAIVIAVILFPIIWMIPSAFKDRKEIWSLPNTFIPQNPSFDNFKSILELDYNDYSFVSSLFYTFVVAVCAVLLSLTVNMFAAYSFARLEFRGKRFLWNFFLITMFIPGITILLTSIRIVNLMRITDTLLVLIIPGVTSAYNIFFFRQFFYSIPQSLEEAAVIDGSSRFKVFLKVFLPMSVTPMIIIGVSVFMGYWNSFMWPTLTIINRPEYAQIMQLIRVLYSAGSGKFGEVVAATLMSIMIPLAVFAVFQKKIVEGIAISGLK